MFDVSKKIKLYPKQSSVINNPYASPKEILENRVVKKEVRGHAAPETAFTTDYIDRKCPFTGDVNVTGKIYQGVVKKMRAE